MSGTVLAYHLKVTLFWFVWQSKDIKCQKYKTRHNPTTVTEYLNKVTNVKNEGEDGKDHGWRSGVEEKVYNSKWVTKGFKDKQKVFFLLKMGDFFPRKITNIFFCKCNIVSRFPGFFFFFFVKICKTNIVLDLTIL